MLLVGLVFIGQLPAPSDGGDRPILRIEKRRVPVNRQLEFLPANEITERIAESELDALLQQYNARRGSASQRRPVACRLTAQLDPATGRLLGSAKWHVPAAETSEIVLTPWNLVLKDLVTQDPNSTVGASADGRLIVSTGERGPLVIATDWELTPYRLHDRLRFELRVPPCASAILDLELPAGWSVRTAVNHRELVGKAVIHRLLFDGAADLVFWAIPTAARSESVRPIIWEGVQRCRFRESRVDVEASVSVRSLREPIDRITLMLDRGIRPQQIHVSVPAQVRWEGAGAAHYRLSVELNRGSLGPFDIQFSYGKTLERDQPWRPSAFAVEGALPRGETIHFVTPLELGIAGVDPGSYELTSAELRENGYWLEFLGTGELSGRGDLALNVRPAFTPAVYKPRVEVVRSELDLDVSEDEALLEAQIEWRSLRGSLPRATVWVPAGWDVVRVRSEAGSPPITWDVGPSADAGRLLWLRPAETTQFSEKLTTTITAVSAEYASRAASGDPCELPEIRPTDVPATLTGRYRINTHPTLTLDASQLPSLDEATGRVATTGDTRSASYAFRYASPLSPRILARWRPRPPRLEAEHRQILRRSADGWSLEAQTTVMVHEGRASRIQVRATCPLPKLTWRVENGTESQTTEPIPRMNSAANDGIHHYDFALVTPVEGRARLKTEWMIPGPRCDVPLIEIANSIPFSAEVAIINPGAEALDVNANGMSVSPTLELDGQLADINWAGRYSRLSSESRLSVAAFPDSAPPLQRGTASIRGRTVVRGKRCTTEMLLHLHCRIPSALRLRIPEKSECLEAQRDGRAVRPLIAEGAVTFPGELAVGPNEVQIAYLHDSPRWCGLPAVHATVPSDDWDITGFTWDVVYFDGWRPWPDRGLTSLGAVPLRPARINADRNRDRLTPRNSEQTSVFGRLNAAYSEAAAEGLEDVAVLVRLASALPHGWLLVVDRDAMGLLAATPGESSPNDWAEWLAERALLPIIRERTVVVTNCELGDKANIEANDNGENWFDRTISDVRHYGRDAAGRFMTVGHWSEAPNPVTSKALPSAPFLTGGESWVSTFIGDVSPQRPTVRIVLVPVSLIVRASWIVGGAFLVALWLARRRLSDGILYRTLVSTLGVAVLVVVLGGVCDQLLSGPIWMLVLVLSGWRFARFARAPWTAAAALAAIGGAAESIYAQPVLSDSTGGRYQVLIPYDPAEPRQSGLAVVPHSLLKMLREPPSGPASRLLLRVADYRGELVSSNQVFWRARFEGSLDVSANVPHPAALRFGGIQPRRVIVNGSAVAFEAGSENAGLEFRIPELGRLEIQVEFHTPLLGAGPQRELDFHIPLVPLTRWQLDLKDRRVQLVNDPGVVDASLDASKTGTWLHGILGPAQRILLRWRESQPNPLAPALVRVTSTQLVDIHRQAADAVAVLQFEVSNGFMDQLAIALDSSLVVRRVDAEGLGDDWYVEDRPSDDSAKDEPPSRILRLFFRNHRTGLVDVRVQCLARAPRLSSFDVPLLQPMNVAQESGIIGVRVPIGWSVQEPHAKNMEIESVRVFEAEWERLWATSMDRIVIVRRFRRQPARLRLSLAPAQPAWSVQQTLDVQPTPTVGAAHVTNRAVVRVRAGTLPMISIQLPEQFQLDGVRGKQLYQWFQRERTLTLLFERAVTERWECQVEGRFRGASDQPVKSRVTLPLSGFRWLGAESVNALWSLRETKNWEGRFADLDGVRALDPATVESTRPDHSIRIDLDPMRVPATEQAGHPLGSPARSPTNLPDLPSPTTTALPSGRTEVDIVVTPFGDAWGVSRWKVHDRGEASLIIESAPTCKVRRVLGDGRYLIPARIGANQWRVSPFRRSTSKEIELYWSTPRTAVLAGRINLPLLSGVQPEASTLVSVRFPGGWEVTAPGEPIDRAIWLADRLDDAVDRLADLLQQPTSVAGKIVPDEVVRLLGRIDVLRWQLEEALRIEPAPVRPPATDGGEALSVIARRLRDAANRRNAFVDRFKLEQDIANNTVSTGEVEPFTNQPGANNTAYFRLPAAEPIVRIVRRQSGQTARSSDRPVRAISALGGLIFVVLPSVPILLRRFWPVVLLAVALAWIHMTSLVWFGLAGLAASLIGAWSVVRAWSHPVADRDIGTTVSYPQPPQFQGSLWLHGVRMKDGNTMAGPGTT
jgi:hypothetical protein